MLPTSTDHNVAVSVDLFCFHIVYFQKISIPPPWKGFFLRPPAPLEIPIKLTYVSLNFLALQNPPPPRQFQSLLWVEFGYFLELLIYLFTCIYLYF